MANDLGLLGFDDPKTLGLLSLGLRLMSTPGKFGAALGQSGLGALGDMQAATAQAEDRKRRALQDQMMQAQLAQQRKQQERAAAVEAAYRDAFRSPEQQALAGGGGPTVANAAKLPGLQPTIDQGALLRGLMQADPMTAAGMMQDKPDYKVVGGSLVRVGKGGASEVYREPTKPDKPTSDVQNFRAAMDDPRFAQFLITQNRAKAPSTSVRIDQGQKGYENESKLRNDFKSEPIYKEWQDTQSAYKQIKQALKQGTPIGDTAAATKIMKILDPGSVVRESELAMAMAAAGKIDRLTNYVQMWASGQKLTPQQRIDFGTLADEFAGAAQSAYNNKRAEYAEFGGRYGLNDSVLGPPATAAQKRRVYNPATGKIE